MVCCLLIHVYLVKFLDLTLLAANSANCIVGAIIWSYLILGEKITLRYDVPALILISIGCVTIAINANTQESTYTADEVKELLTSPRTLCYLGFTFSLIIISVFCMTLVLSRLRRFERDIDDE